MAAIAVAPPGVGPEELTEEFLRRRTQLQAVIFRIVRSWDEAQSLTQDCFVRAFRARHTFTGQASLGTWLTRIAINLAYEWLRRVRANFFSAEQPAIATELRSVKASGPSPEQSVAVRQQSEFVQELLHRLPPHHRILIEYRYLHDMSVEEIVERTGLSMTTVKARLNRARATLRKRTATVDLPSIAAELPPTTSSMLASY